MESLMNNLSLQLHTLAKKQQAHNTELLQKKLRKLAFDKASSGYMHLHYTVGIPFEADALQAHFTEQNIVCSIKYYNAQAGIYLAWGTVES
jgi:hypothetical protein